MGRILFCWEQGANLGHLARMLAVAGPLAQQGHQIGFLLRDLSRAELILGANGFAEAYTQAPVWLPKASHPPPALNYASVLIHAGWLDPQGLLGLCRAWRKQFELFSPDLLIFDHSPTALLAARNWPCSKVVIGNGFEIPPVEHPFPAYAWWRPPPDAALRDYEQPVLEKANSVLADLGATHMAALADLFRGLPTYLSAYPETDHYPRRQGVEHLGWLRSPGGHEPPRWPDRGVHKVFAYLMAGYPALDSLLDALRRSDLATLVYIPGLSADVVRKHRADNLAFAERPLDMDAVVKAAAALVCHSPGTAHAALLAGLPLLLLPTQMEQWMAARRMAELGAGICLEPAEARNGCPEALERLLKDAGLARRARQFAATHADAKGEALLARILSGCEGLLAGAA